MQSTVSKRKKNMTNTYTYIEYLRWVYFFFLKKKWFIHCSFCLCFGHLSCMRNGKLVLTDISSNFLALFSPKSIIAWIMVLNETRNPRTICSTWCADTHLFSMTKTKKRHSSIVDL
jgi:hypothetical protein